MQNAVKKKAIIDEEPKRGLGGAFASACSSGSSGCDVRFGHVSGLSSSSTGFPVQQSQTNPNRVTQGLGGAMIGNMIMPGIGGAVVGGLLGGLL